MLLKRYSFPCRYSDMIPIFGRPVPELCMICNTVTDWIYAHRSHRITQWNRTILNPLELEKYAEAVFNQGAPLSNCFGFVDGTVRPITQPGENQRLLYNGHKRVHGLKFQSVVLPNGLIAHLYGPVGKACYQQITMLIITTKFKTIEEKVSKNFIGFSIDCPHPHPQPAHSPLASLRPTINK